MSFDPVALVFYAAVCGTLAAYAPSAGGKMQRAFVGALVGMVAAFVLAVARQWIGM
jgi:hypothetical protein